MPISRNIYKNGRLTARPAHGTEYGNPATGLQPLKLNQDKDSYVYIPATYTHNKPCALAVMLHGAGGDANHGLSLIKSYADEHCIIIVAPASREYSWDIIALNTFGPDVILIDEALSYVFKNYRIDTTKLAIGGFSDGASYALCLGLSNGDLFSHIMAFSPGFAYAKEQIGKPAVFISHGIKDDILPIKPCSDRIVKELKENDLNPVYIKFDGAHQIPLHVSQAAIEWFCG